MLGRNKTVGFIGLGIMGKSMAGNLLDAGFPLVVHNRSRAAVAELVSHGAYEAHSPQEVARHASRVITMLPDSPDVVTVATGRDGLFSALEGGDIVIDCSTISPQVTEELADQASRRGFEWLDAPVSGGPAGAAAATLSIMVGGSASALERARPVLQVMGKTITHIGEKAGSGQVAKACNQVAAGLTLLAVCEALLLAQGAGVDPLKVYQAIHNGAAGSWQMETQGPKILEGEHAPGFKAWMHLKDLRIALETAQKSDLPLPGTAQLVQLYTSLVAAGRGEENISVLITTLEKLSGQKITSRHLEREST